MALQLSLMVSSLSLMVLQLSFMVSSQLEYPLINVSTIGLDGPFVVVRCGGVMKRYWRRVLSWAQIMIVLRLWLIAWYASGIHSGMHAEASRWHFFYENNIWKTRRM
jgi:hypothetical protein